MFMYSAIQQLCISNEGLQIGVMSGPRAIYGAHVIVEHMLESRMQHATPLAGK